MTKPHHMSKPLEQAPYLKNPETIRFLARDRADTLKKARATYRFDLDEARDAYDHAKTLLEEATGRLSVLKARLKPLDEQIAHLEAVAATEDATFEMLFPDLKETE